jgi:ribosome maturation factor RimP
MDSILAKIKESIEAPLKEMDIFVDSVTWELENNYYYLKIVLDKVNGIDLDTIVDATNVINPIVDKLDLIQEEYILDVSSKERGE